MNQDFLSDDNSWFKYEIDFIDRPYSFDSFMSLPLEFQTKVAIDDLDKGVAIGVMIFDSPSGSFFHFAEMGVIPRGSSKSFITDELLKSFNMGLNNAAPYGAVVLGFFVSVKS